MLSQPPLWFILVAFLAALGPLVFFHELGHYLVARVFGVGAESFSIGFGREIAGWTDIWLSSATAKSAPSRCRPQLLWNKTNSVRSIGSDALACSAASARMRNCPSPS